MCMWVGGWSLDRGKEVDGLGWRIPGCRRVNIKSLRWERLNVVSNIHSVSIWKAGSKGRSLGCWLYGMSGDSESLLR